MLTNNFDIRERSYQLGLPGIAQDVPCLYGTSFVPAEFIQITIRIEPEATQLELPFPDDSYKRAVTSERSVAVPERAVLGGASRIPWM